MTIVGTGLSIAGHLTQEAMSVIQEADRLLYLVSNAVTGYWLETLSPGAVPLVDSYREGRDRKETYAEIVERILEPVREGKRVVAAFYGHPGVFADPPHAAIRAARSEGFEAVMLPGISAEDCLVADLGIDPGECGFQTYEATDFLVRPRRFDTSSYLVLWQIGAIGVRDYRRDRLWNRKGLAVLQDCLLKHYPEKHIGIVYEAVAMPLVPCKIERVQLRDLATADVSVRSTLCIPPSESRETSQEMWKRLEL